MLTGWSCPTLGKVTIWGHNVAEDEGATTVRHLVGYCPQYEIVFPNMTAFQHIEIYAVLRGVNLLAEGGINDYVSRMLSKVGLLSYKNQIVDTFSGGT